MEKDIKGISDVIDRYNLFIFDVWGTIHDGDKLYPATINVLEFLYSQKKTVCLLSNSPKTNVHIEEKLRKSGLDKKLYTTIYTAADVFFEKFSSHYYSTKGAWFVLDHTSVSEAKQALQENKMLITDNFLEAENIIIASIDENDLALGSYNNFINYCAHSKPKVFSMNPDTHVTTPQGVLARPGVLTQKLRSLNCPVIQHGKPDNTMYQALFQMLHISSSDKILMIGDSFNTDVQGAINAGIDSMLIYGSYTPAKALQHFAIQLNTLTPNITVPSIDDVRRFILQSTISPNYYLQELKI